MNYKDFTERFRIWIDAVSYDRKLDLALSICKMLFPDYQKFHKENNWGDPDVLLDAINLIGHSKTKELHQSALRTILQNINAIIPDLEDFHDSSYALNAAAAVYETVKFLSNRRAQHIYNIGIYLLDTVDFKVQEGEELSESEIAAHPLMIETQNYLLAIEVDSPKLYYSFHSQTYRQ